MNRTIPPGKQHWKTVLPVPVHEVVYQQLVDDFETEASRMWRYAAWNGSRLTPAYAGLRPFP